MSRDVLSANNISNTSNANNAFQRCPKWILARLTQRFLYVWQQRTPSHQQPFSNYVFIFKLASKAAEAIQLKLQGNSSIQIPKSFLQTMASHLPVMPSHSSKHQEHQWKTSLNHILTSTAPYMHSPQEVLYNRKKECPGQPSKAVDFEDI